MSSFFVIRENDPPTFRYRASIVEGDISNRRETKFLLICVASSGTSGRLARNLPLRGSVRTLRFFDRARDLLRGRDRLRRRGILKDATHFKKRGGIVDFFRSTKCNTMQASERIDKKVKQIIARSPHDQERIDRHINDEIDMNEILTIGLMPVNS